MREARIRGLVRVASSVGRKRQVNASWGASRVQCRCNRVRDGERCYLTANSKIVAGGRVIKLNVADLSWAGLHWARWARWARWLPCNRLSIVQTLKESSHPALT